MFDGLFEVFAKTLSFFYDLIPNYAVAIALLTLAVMVVTTPLTLKSSRSMIQMQRLQPELRRLQQKYKDDRPKMQEELMRLYQEEGMSPFGGCLPMLVQAPLFIILFNMVRGLTHLPGDATTFQPKYLDEASKLFRDLSGVDEMLAFGVDLAESASSALSAGFVHGLPHVLMVAVVAVSSYVQQKQVQGRNPNAEIPAQQKMLMRIFPAMFVVIAFVSPAALVVYFVTSNLYRIGVQAYITRTLYSGEDSPGAQARRAAEAARAKGDDAATSTNGKNGRRDRTVRDTTATDTTATAGDAGQGSGRTPAPARGAGGSPKPTSRTTTTRNRSKKKKKRR